MNKINIAIIVSEFNQKITSALLEGALSALAKASIRSDQLHVVKVPGAGEIPLIAKVLAKKNKYDAIICLGAVIRGDTDHYDYVCQQVSQGYQHVMLEFEIPLIFGVLTTHNEEQAWARLGGAEGHKGEDAAMTALSMIKLMRELG
ncbi:MAG: 6,7-dimethyl-8-ribityllumazine synthase [Gammaproteobacteria bacterium]|nr:6,7-dimethyl-8-ribityllumazine synthase [Gammaproteobacteria bacterium]